MSKQLKLGPNHLQQSKESRFRQYMIYGDVLTDNWEIVRKSEVPPLESENSICATSCGHLSNISRFGPHSLWLKSALSECICFVIRMPNMSKLPLYLNERPQIPSDPLLSEILGPSLPVPKYVFYRYNVTAEWHNGYATCAEWQSRTNIMFGPKCSNDQLRLVLPSKCCCRMFLSH